ncbi:glycosylphosphatidylinositol anchor biosynthesis [Dimargaris xerosporica]|nr:glycosylphosphatidylinositol anchor biosynthesis [Dimargaris xerosporica]
MAGGRLLTTLAAIWLCWVPQATVASQVDSHPKVDAFFRQPTHSNNWAVLVCTSRFWFNYRHIANTLSMYRTVKRLGIPDSNIILMLADDVACNPRNKSPATIYHHPNQAIDLYGQNVEVDYRGYDVTVENFIRLLTGRVKRDTPRSKRLLTDDKSNIFIYMTGHGGDEFLKFQDAEEISSHDIADAFAQMWEKKRYHEILFIIDTCQANTMYTQFYSPNVLAMGSSRKGENSYSYLHDHDIGVSVIDRFTYFNLEYLENIDMQSRATFQDLIDTYDTNRISSHPGIRTDLFPRPLDQVLLTDFLGAVQNVELTTESVDLVPAEASKTSDEVPPEPNAHPVAKDTPISPSLAPTAAIPTPLSTQHAVQDHMTWSRRLAQLSLVVGVVGAMALSL